MRLSLSSSRSRVQMSDNAMEAHKAARNADEARASSVPTRASRPRMQPSAHQRTSQQRTATRAACECCTSSAPARACQQRMQPSSHQPLAPQQTATRAACECCTSSAPARSCQRRMQTRRHQRTMQQQTATRAACECCTSVNAGLMIDPLLKGLSRFRSATTTAATHEPEAKRSLATRSGTNETPSHQAAVEGYTGCVRFLSEI